MPCGRGHGLSDSRSQGAHALTFAPLTRVSVVMAREIAPARRLFTVDPTQTANEHRACQNRKKVENAEAQSDHCRPQRAEITESEGHYRGL